MHALTLRAGRHAYRLIRDRGLRAEDVDVIPAASGGAKWLSIAGLDRYLFGEFLQAPRQRPMHLIGSSIGSWRMACLAQRDPVAALGRGHRAYIYEQRYTRKPSPAEVTTVLGRALDLMLGPTGVDEMLSHPWARLHVITGEGRGLAATGRRTPLMAALAVAVTGNLVSRRALGLVMRRWVFNSGPEAPFAHLSDLPTRHDRLTPTNARDVLLASGAIPLLVDGVRIPGVPGGVHWDGGVLDYHLDLDFGGGDGLVLYPHFYSHIVPGWFDKSLRWRRAGAGNFQRALLIAPSDEFVATLPGGKIPDRRDFYTFSDAERFRRWQAVVDASEAVGDELRELVETGRVAERLELWGSDP